MGLDSSPKHISAASGWTNISSHMVSTRGAPNLSSVVFIGEEGWLSRGVIIRHFTGGAWQADQTYATDGYNAIGFADGVNGWAVGDTGIIIHTVTGGKYDGNPGTGWIGQSNPAQGITLNDIP